MSQLTRESWTCSAHRPSTSSATTAAALFLLIGLVAGRSRMAGYISKGFDDESSADQLLPSSGEARVGEDDVGGATICLAGTAGAQAIAARWSWMKPAGTVAGRPPAPRRPRCAPTSAPRTPVSAGRGAPPMLPPRRRQVRRPRP
jgi:hypothetical protein